MPGRKDDPNYKRPEYSVWCNLKSRCNNPNFTDYESYGGRGIRVSTEWQSSFERFLSDMGARPSPLHQIDRIDNDGPYSRENCRWATSAENNRNKRTSRQIFHDGRTMCLTDWATKHGIHYMALHGRLKAGMSMREALTLPSLKGKSLKPYIKEPKT